MYIYITINIILGCTAYDADESSAACVECAPASRGRFLSVDKCVGKCFV